MSRSQDDSPLWSPSPERVEAAHLTRFARQARAAHVLDFADADYEALWRWSVTEREAFWLELWNYAGIVAKCRGERVLIDGDRMPGARWFPDARLNYAENMLQRRDAAEAIVSWTECGRQEALSYRELYDRTARLAATLRSWGLQPGDRIAAMLPNTPEAIVLLLAASSLGVVFSSCSPDFGVPGAVDRFGQIGPRVLFVAEGYRYGGKTFDTLSKGIAIAAEIPSIERCVLVPCLSGAATASPSTPPATATPPAQRALPDGRWSTWEAAISGPPVALEFEPLPFDHPLYILYSSGTTGKPKCIVHGAGGTLLQHRKEHLLHSDVHEGDRLFYFTTTGWMMWNWLVSGLATGATLVLFDGSPFSPSERVLWDMAEAERVTGLGVSAKYLSALEKTGLRPIDTHRLESLRAIFSTGSPLAPELFDYVYSGIKRDVCLSSISGGTDIVSCFLLGNPTGPVYRGELQARGLGMAVDVFDEQGRSRIDEKGELVCTKAFPSMPIGFWNDPDGSRYRAAYFERFPNVWCHGDYTALTGHGGAVIYGRSDAVLNPGGVRIGTAEIYRQVEQIPEVLESIAVGQQWEGDERVLLFVRLRDGVVLDDPLRQRIARQIRAGATPRHVPSRILQVAEIPRTRSGKVVELAVTEVIHDRPVKNLEALANPDALRLFAEHPELREP